MLHSAFPNVVLCFDCVVCSGDGSRSMQDEKSSVSQPSPATLLLLFLLFDLQLSCLFNLLLCPLRFFGDGMLFFLFLYRLCQEKQLRCEFKHCQCELHFQQTSYSGSIDGRQITSGRQMFTFSVVFFDFFFLSSTPLSSCCPCCFFFFFELQVTRRHTEY